MLLMRRYILLIVALVSCTSIFGQDLHDYRYYKRFEDTIESDRAAEVADSIAIALSRLPVTRPKTRIFDYNFAFVNASRRGVHYLERDVRIAGLDIVRISQSEAMRLQLTHKDTDGAIIGGTGAGSPSGNDRYGFDTLVQRRTSVAFNLSSRNYLAGITANTCADLGRGWLLAADITARTGRDAHVDGIFANTLSLNAVATKRIDSLQTVSLALFFAPSERGIRQSSTAEAFSLTDDNLYNPSWGLQNGKIRNQHVRRRIIPAFMAAYSGQLSGRTSLHVSAGASVGTSRYSTLDWFDAQTPVPDNYRYMPSYFSDGIDEEVATAWRADDERYTQINFDELIARNRLAGGAAIYVMADRTELLTRLQLNALGNTSFGEKFRLLYGLDMHYDRSRRYKQLRDMLGSEYLVDIDYFLVDDDTFGNSLQNDLNNPDRKAVCGDRYGYDYALTRRSIMAMAQLQYTTKKLHAEAVLEVGRSTTMRRGYYRKQLFADNSFGRSKSIGMTPYRIRLAAAYELSARHRFELALSACGDAPDMDDMFLQADYNNRTTDSPALRKSLSAEFNYVLNIQRLQFRATLFATHTRDEANVLHRYDDIAALYTDMVVERIGRLCYGFEGELSWRWADQWKSGVVFGAGRYKYAGNPLVSLYSDSDNTLIADRIESHVGGYTLGGAPQILAAATLSYFNRGWGANLAANYAGLRYVAPDYLRRTERVAYMATSPEAFDEIVRQERLRDAFTLDVSLSKTLYLSRYDRHIYRRPGAPRFLDRHPRSRVTLFLSVRNLLGTDNIMQSGYESSRLIRRRVADSYIYSPQPTRYLYAYPRTYYFSVKFTF